MTIIAAGMGGHWHDSRAGTQNQGNHIGDRPCVRQSKLYRKYESGNSIKDLLGQGSLKWDENRKQGAYSGKVYDHNKADHSLAAKTRERTVQDNQEAIKMAEEAQRRMPAYPLAPQYMEEEAPAVRLVPSNPRRVSNKFSFINEGMGDDGSFDHAFGRTTAPSYSSRAGE
uniref:Uncharacterized protein n=1 Tax=Guillardia theta TaxID=55529 RepID=A0A7S4PQ04_GUITH|mmetsp:Transcript_8219/g.27621  ORF Transcript_8219/g.27621 Transcript_8219/m.27621 type:complete len:170 (+) Transcript_8219:256-765(+)